MRLVSISNKEDNHKGTKIFNILCVFVSLWFSSLSSVFYYFFYICGGLLLIQGLIALRGGFHYLSYVRASMRSKNPDQFTPRVALIAPCKGLDDRMGDYLRSLFELDYPHYQIIFVVESDTDSAAAEIARFQERYPNIRSECVIAGRSHNCGQKVHNLLAAIAAAGADVEAFAFVDSDVCLRKDWLRSLIAPLEDPEVGATTGYRWFIPTESFTSLLRSAWNASIATTLGGHRNNFAWGGSMAILRKTFERIDMPGYWKGTVSDDFALTRAVKAAGLYVKFVPACLVPSFGNCTMSELLEFTSRQIIITRVYSNGLWRLLLISNIFFNLIFSLGIFLSVYSLLTSHGYWPIVITASIYLLSVWKGYLRIKAIKLILVEYDLKQRWGYYLLAPVVSLIFLHNLLVSISTNRITWRGITYELRSVNETAIAREG